MSAVILANSVLVGATLAASTTAQGFDVRYLRDWRTYTRWEATGTAAQLITIDCLTSKQADMIGIEAHNLAGLTLTVQTSADGLAWANHATVQAAAGTILARFTATASRWWRLSIPIAATPARIGVLAIGKALDMPLISGEYTPLEETPRMDVQISESGALLGAVVSHIETSVSVPFEHVDDTWLRQTFKPVWDAHLAAGVPFFWCNEIDGGLVPDAAYMRIEPGSAFSAAYHYGGRRRFNLKMTGVK